MRMQYWENKIQANSYHYGADDGADKGKRKYLQQLPLQALCVYIYGTGKQQWPQHAF